MKQERLLELSGVITEAKEAKSMLKCPICGEEMEHGKVLAHIRSAHADLCKGKTEKSDDKE